ncbi:NAD(P)H-hydrate dehydratase [Clostridium sp. CMCC3677]|uniref:NAD(P)H-hydrate dehydratase n=1 Tax=Clostridium sp. CMCC3677 TaxID=2949963 RepID=UPI0013F04B09|nr:NAD(P)H-hydrate dehydratase [Clostridium sp. CMCC3677]NFG62788.1 NAD(P)H-hydrate dehydratase [Clostridium botulinum]NFQ08044.1 NAD(P)H-hydrate dehydratase [Clostridium botulinum]
MEIMSSKKCKLIDELTINEIGIPSIVLMENAAISIYKEIYNMGDSFLVICGQGNNGGDGLAISRHLFNNGKKVKVYIVGVNENYSDDFKLNLKILTNLENIEIKKIRSEEDIDINLVNDIKKFDVVVDAIFGIGLNRDLKGLFKTIIDEINVNSNIIVSVDVPSGLDCDEGVPKGISIRANYTYTFEVIKKGFLSYKAIEYLGNIKVVNIGIPQKIKKQNNDGICILDDPEYKKLIPKRNIYGHKGNYGRAIIIAGSSGFTGAAFITTECTVRSGAGLVTLVCPKEIQPILSNKLIEAMTLNTEDEKLNELLKGAQVIAIGPGLGTGEKEKQLFEKVVKETTCPIIIDADAITLLSKNKSLLKYLENRAIMTPHPGELARFLDIKISEVEDDRISVVKKFFKDYRINLLLKGYKTVICVHNKTYINETGNSKMASGGMGDALTGIITGLISQGVNIEEATVLGTYIHGKLADEISQNSFIVNARDIINNLPTKINNILN